MRCVLFFNDFGLELVWFGNINYFYLNKFI